VVPVDLRGVRLEAAPRILSGAARSLNSRRGPAFEQTRRDLHA